MLSSPMDVCCTVLWCPLACGQAAQPHGRLERLLSVSSERKRLGKRLLRRNILYRRCPGQSVRVVASEKWYESKNTYLCNSGNSKFTGKTRRVCLTYLTLEYVLCTFKLHILYTLPRAVFLMYHPQGSWKSCCNDNDCVVLCNFQHFNYTRGLCRMKECQPPGQP